MKTKLLKHEETDHDDFGFHYRGFEIQGPYKDGSYSICTDGYERFDSKEEAKESVDMEFSKEDSHIYELKVEIKQLENKIEKLQAENKELKERLNQYPPL